MEPWAAVDSRQYIVAFELHSPRGCPPDFHLPPSLSGFDTGLFLPRDDPDWFGRCSYPPRILLLKGSVLYILPHPSTHGPACECPIEKLVSVESGQMLLKGWLRFTGAGFDCTLPYNTRGFPCVFSFMRRLRDKALGGAAPNGAPEVRLGAGLDIKFANALTRELDSGEQVAAQFFQPPKELKSNRWLIPRRHWLPGDLVVVTGRRLLWISDRERGSYSRYGSVASYAPLGAVRALELIPDRGGLTLDVALRGESHWQIPIRPENRRDADDFAAVVGRSRN